jgi:hypothetical protein
MYTLALTLHSWVRWFVLLAGVLATTHALRSSQSGAEYPKKVPVFLAFMIAVDLQLTLGLVLWATSPTVAAGHAAMGAAMKDPLVRFWMVEHEFTALVGVVLVHLGYALGKREGDAAAKFKRAAMLFGFAWVTFLVANPWPFRLVGRPLFRL